MRIIDLFKMGLSNLLRRKLRTFLTVIGVVIGTFSIVVMVSIGIGMNEGYKKQIMQLGSLTTITVDQYYFPEEGRGGPSEPKTLDDKFVEQIKAMEHVVAVTPIMQKSAKLIAGKYVAWVYVTALDTDVLKQFDFPELTIGEYVTPENPEGIILGKDAVYFYDPKRGYSNTQPEIDYTKDKISLTFDYSYGEKQWGGKPNEQVSKKAALHRLKTIGIMEQSQTEKDYSSYMDIGVFKKYYREYVKTLPLEQRKREEESLKSYNSVWISVDNIKYVDKVQQAIKDMGYGARSLGDMLKPMQETSNMLQLVLGGIGAISMLVSAIGIANTMIMSIYERTKEIGIMKVLGCLVSDVKKLFLFEATLIGLFGGLLGVGMSYLSSYLINNYGGNTIGKIFGGGMYYGGPEGMKFSVIPTWLAFLALLFAVTVGVVSGYYPAKRATKISAIEAMKTES